MKIISALSLAPGVNTWLADTHHPRILHVFGNVCNLINEHGEVLSIVTSQIGNGPFNIVVEGDNNFTEQLSLESLVSTSRTQLTLGDLTIDMTDTKLWRPRPEWEQLYESRVDIIHQLASFPIPAHKLSIPSALISTFTASVVSVDISTFINAAQKLAGLGVGLTPEGDDFIMGAILAAWILHPPDVASELAKEITDTVAPLTTSLSAAWLKSAGRGEAGQVWHDLFDALISADKMVIQESVDQLLSVGHTSGADALTGFLGVFNSYAEQK